MGSLRDRLILSDSPEHKRQAARALNQSTSHLLREGWSIKRVYPRTLVKDGIEIVIEVTGKAV